MKRYDIYDERGSRKGEIREEEYGKEGMNIYDERGSKIGEVKPRYSGGGGGGGCGITIAIIISIMFEIGLIIYGDFLTKLMVILLQGADVLSCVISRKKLKDKYGELRSEDYGYLAFVPIIISYFIKTPIFIIITLFDNSEYWFVGIIVNLIISLPVAVINFLVNVIMSLKYDKY